MLSLEKFILAKLDTTNLRSDLNYRKNVYAYSTKEIKAVIHTYQSSLMRKETAFKKGSLQKANSKCYDAIEENPVF